jgi:UPF0176 protein
MGRAGVMDAMPICVAALYQFAPFADCAAMRAPLATLCRQHGVKGTLLLAPEGINGTIAGSDGGIDAVLGYIRGLPHCAGLAVKFSRAAVMPFHRMKVRLKREIVTMGQPEIDPLASVGIDTRNDYEVAIGTFRGAVDPQTASFRDFPVWFRRERERLLGQGKPPKVAMFCTGGIRCEKSTAFLKAEGVEQVYHLRGGILKYLEEVPAEESLWQGECFVFDKRVSVGPGLAPGSHALCHACRRPVGAADQAAPEFEPGVSCPACFGERSDEQRAGYRERHRQEALAAARGGAHVGAQLA